MWVRTYIHSRTQVKGSERAFTRRYKICTNTPTGVNVFRLILQRGGWLCETYCDSAKRAHNCLIYRVGGKSTQGWAGDIPHPHPPNVRISIRAHRDLCTEIAQLHLRNLVRMCWVESIAQSIPNSHLWAWVVPGLFTSSRELANRVLIVFRVRVWTSRYNQWSSIGNWILCLFVYFWRILADILSFVCMCGWMFFFLLIFDIFMELNHILHM